MKLDNRGFGAKEIMISMLVIIILVIVVSQTFLKQIDEQSFSTLKKLANKFGDQAALVRDEDARFTEVVYLIDLLHDHNRYATEEDYASPFSSSTCDLYESKIYNYRDEKRITFKCDVYIIADHSKGNTLVRIAKVGPWLPSDTEIAEEAMAASNIETTKFYSLGDGSMPGFYRERVFVEKYNELKNTNFVTLVQVQNKAKVVEKIYYRTNDFVDER